MKKIISIILGILLMFSMSVTSFAGFVREDDTTTTTVVETTKAPDPESFSISVSYELSSKDKEALVTVEDKDNSLISYTGRKCTFTITVKNNTNTAISGAIINDFEPIFTDKDGNVITIYNAKGSGFIGEKTPEKIGIDSEGGEAKFTYVAYIATTKSVKDITINVFGETDILDVNNKTKTLKFVWKIDDGIIEPEEDTSAPSESEPTEPDVTEKEETSTSTTQPSTDAPEVTNPTTPETEKPSKAPADVDDTIPDTGATVPFAAIGTFVTSAITALVAKKKKEN
jgi:hypothetical protein